MTNKTKIIIGVGSAVALVGGYFIYKALRPKKPMINGTKDETKSSTTTTTPSTNTTIPTTPTKSTTTTTPSTNTTIPTTPTKSTTPSTNTIKNYKVLASILNAREKPNTNSIIVAKIPKDCIIKAIPSSTNGWMEMKSWIDDGKCAYEPNGQYYAEIYEANHQSYVGIGFGFISSQYLKEIK